MFRCTYIVAALLTVAPLVAEAQVQRAFPRNALRGTIEFNVPPSVDVNGDAADLAPGVRIRDTNNMLVMSGALVGKKLKVNYTFDTLGFVSNIWILTPQELEKIWPRTPKEAAAWSFDDVGQVWTKP